VSSALTSHSRLANLSSWDTTEERASAFLAKYLPLTPSTSGEDAKYMEVSAPFSGLFMRGVNALTVNPKTPETPLPKLVRIPAPGCRQLALTPVPSSLLASS
jgi:hypothetical protein